MRDVAVQQLAAQLCSHLNHHSISLKNAEWSTEREWRTIFSVLSNESEDRKARIKVRSDGRPYVDVPVRSVDPDDTRLPIIRVTAGADADVQRIRQMLADFSYGSVPIGRSAVDVAHPPRWPPGFSLR